MTEQALLSKPRVFKRNKTTTLKDYGPVWTRPRDLQARVLSPTRRSNPQPLGLLYQSPLSNTKSYAIWNPDFRHTRHRFPELLQHLDLTNFSCGVPSQSSPWNTERAGPPEIKYSLQSTSRFSFQDPTVYPVRQKTGHRKQPTRYDFRPTVGPAVGIVPNVLPQLPDADTSIVNAKQGEDPRSSKKHTDKKHVAWTNAALREIWHSSGRRPVSRLSLE
ncbi:uncharacterized protein LOC116621507 [Nematostella vectensis]|uniref:uncharacterized protein LOC116621507 n=1 Tax=Nematostella vectensis TaxID=45351 RepID=UPI0020772332|nr:uncharacterized protein LOC116621507 [Nematostella vectensis]